MGHTAWNKGLTKETDSRVAKYGHSRKGNRNTAPNPNKGKPLSEEHKQKLSIVHKGSRPWMIGRHHTEETKEKIRQAKLGKKHTIETLLLMKQTNGRSKLAREIRLCACGCKTTFEVIITSPKRYIRFHDRKLRKFSEETRRKIQSKRLLQVLPVKDTSIERKVQNELKIRNIEFEVHKSILNKTQVDIFIEPNICVYLDGCYFHYCECLLDKVNFDTPLGHQIIKRRNHELETTEYLKKQGFVVFRFWEHEINKDINFCVEKIEQELICNPEKLI